MDHFVFKKRHILHLFSDHKDMSAGEIVMADLSWNSNLFRNNPVETQNQKNSFVQSYEMTSKKQI